MLSYWSKRKQRNREQLLSDIRQAVQESFPQVAHDEATSVAIDVNEGKTVLSISILGIVIAAVVGLANNLTDTGTLVLFFTQLVLFYGAFILIKVLGRSGWSTWRLFVISLWVWVQVGAALLVSRWYRVSGREGPANVNAQPPASNHHVPSTQGAVLTPTPTVVSVVPAMVLAAQFLLVVLVMIGVPAAFFDDIPSTSEIARGATATVSANPTPSPESTLSPTSSPTISPTPSATSEPAPMVEEPTPTPIRPLPALPEPLPNPTPVGGADPNLIDAVGPLGASEFSAYCGQFGHRSARPEQDLTGNQSANWICEGSGDDEFWRITRLAEVCALIYPDFYPAAIESTVTDPNSWMCKGWRI